MGKAVAECFARFTWPNYAKAAQFPFPVNLAGGGSERDTSLPEVRERKGSPAPYRVGEENQNTVRFGARSTYCERTPI